MRKAFLQFCVLGLMALSSSEQITSLACSKENMYEPFLLTSEEPTAGSYVGFYHICLSDQGEAVKKECPDELKFIKALKGCSYAILSTEGGTITCDDGVDKLPDYTDCSKCYTCVSGRADESTPCTTHFNFFLNSFSTTAEYNCKAEEANGRPDCKTHKTLYGTKYLVDVNDCQSYYQCLDGIRIKGKCPEGLFFDSATQMCRYEVECLRTTPSSGPNINSICKGKASQFVADTNYCKGYYYCINDTTPYWNFCPDNKYFNNGFCVTSRPDTCTCEDIDYSEQTIIYVPHPDKSKYYICEEGLKVIEESCPNGLIFDFEEESCVRQ